MDKHAKGDLLLLVWQSGLRNLFVILLCDICLCRREDLCNGKKKKVKKRKPSPEQLIKVEHLLAHQSTALEASSMDRAEFCVNGGAGKRARKQFREALKSSGSKECRDKDRLWAIADIYSEMSQKETPNKQQVLL